MSRKQIRVYVDVEQWEALKNEGESDTELQQRLIDTFEAVQQLVEIDQNLSVAIGKALTAYQVVGQVQWQANPVTAVEPIETEPIEAPVIEAEDEFIDNSGEW